MPLEMVLGSKFPWKPGQALPSSVSWLGVGWGAERGAEAQCSPGTGSGGRALWRGRDVQWEHTRATSVNSLPGLLMRDQLQPLGRQRDGTALVLGGRDVGSPHPQTTEHAAAHPQFSHPHLNWAAAVLSPTRHHSCQGGGGVASLASGGHVRGVTRQSGARHVTTWKNTKGKG